MKNDIHVVLRSAQERSFPMALEALRAQTSQYTVIEEYPFRNALKKMFTIGKDIASPYLLALDADVILNPDSLEIIAKEAKIYFENSPDLFFIDFYVMDKFRGKCCSGCHLYLNSHSKDLFNSIEETQDETRPENHLILDFSSHFNLTKTSSQTIVGLHDYEQFYRDLYAKYFRRAQRRSHEVDMLITVIEERKRYRSHADMDFDVVLKGLYDGIQSQTRASFDARCYKNIQDILPLVEKPAILPLK